MIEPQLTPPFPGTFPGTRSGGMTYDQVIKALQTLLEIPLNQEDENFRRIIPLMFTYADNRIYRELEFLATTAMTAGTLTVGNRESRSRVRCWFFGR